MGNEAFDACALAVLEVHQVFSQNLPPDSLQTFELPAKEHGCITLEVSNRYYSTEKESTDLPIVMNPDIDPLSILRERVPATAKHVADNEVLYYERQAAQG